MRTPEDLRNWPCLALAETRHFVDCPCGLDYSNRQDKHRLDGDERRSHPRATGACHRVECIASHGAAIPDERKPIQSNAWNPNHGIATLSLVFDRPCEPVLGCGWGRVATGAGT